MYKPDRSFIDSIKKIHKSLDCYYEPDFERFIVTEKMPVGPPTPVFVVQTEDNQFRRPDKRDIEKLHECDLQREDIDGKFKRVSKQVWEAQEQHRRKTVEDFRDRTKDDKIHLSQKLVRHTNQGKGNSAFRRIAPKQKDEVFK